MLKSFLVKILTTSMMLSISSTAFAKSAVEAAFTSELAGVDVVVRKRKNNKVVGKCVTPCSLKLKTKRNFSIWFSKPEYSSLGTNKSKAVLKDGIYTFHAKLRSMEDIRAADKLKKEQCVAKNIQPKGGDVDRNAQPLVKVTMKKPDEITGSAYCKLKFDVNTSGNPEDIQVIDCSHEILADASKRVIPKWKYVNNRLDGCPVPKTGVETTIVFD